MQRGYENSDVEITNFRPQHPRDRLRRKIKNKEIKEEKNNDDDDVIITDV